MSAKYRLIDSRREGGTLILRVQNIATEAESEWPLTRSKGEQLLHVQRFVVPGQPETETFALAVAKNYKGIIERNRAKVVDADWYDFIECDSLQADFAWIHWQVAKAMDRNPLAPFLQEYSFGKRFVTLNLEMYDGTIKRIRVDHQRALVVFNREYRFMMIQRDGKSGWTASKTIYLTGHVYQLTHLFERMGAAGNQAYKTPELDALEGVQAAQAAD